MSTVKHTSKSQRIWWDSKGMLTYFFGIAGYSVQGAKVAELEKTNEAQRADLTRIQDLKNALVGLRHVYRPGPQL